ncbi:indolepyruvate ferredoxin oxidoreductase [Actinomadura luteofluorescens]|uniref:Indolepyruvate ferredoxin oxidoreductase n=1 Tax=Actinomadura luteofluorescens TaxID=46163 RepID=A0A7Y9EBD2_9ACTN|nr:indolepyruvate ferredoxin oxidoreductase family protein [Actinomadura luteofluorescens]NYD44636.1 indolepyruvate ferredoxin oxidoreductase [Actinomadura luteofluorescens]
MTGPAGRQTRLDDRYELLDGEVYLSGLQALVRLPLDQVRADRAAGRRTAVLVSGYEGSPLAGYDLELARQRRLLDEHEVVFRPGLNEELAANAVQGSQLAESVGELTHDGVVGIWYGKAPGLDRATDALRHANLGGSSAGGGALVLVGDDATAKSSTIPSSSEAAMAEIGMTVLAPADPQDILDLGRHGIALSRFCGLWTGMKLATEVVDGSAVAVVGPERVRPVLPDRTLDGVPFEHRVTARFLQPALGELERSLLTSRVELARRYARANGLNTVAGDPSARVGIVAAGATYRDLRQALTMVGIGEEELASSGVRLLKLGMVAPLEPRIVAEFAAGLDEILVVEDKRPFLETALKDELYGRPGAPLISGKRAPDGSALLPRDGVLTPGVIATAVARRATAHLAAPDLRRWLEERTEPRSPSRGRSPKPLPLVSRAPYFCSGCPHNRSTVTPEGSLVGAGIGCHALAATMPAARVGEIVGLSQMGGEGAVWIGMAPFVRQGHLLQNIGDGTFHHSGSLAVRAAVAAGVNITYKILHNDAVAMTGGQRAVGGMAVPEMAAALLAEGVARIVVTTEDPGRYDGVRLPAGVTVRHRDRLVETQDELAAVPGVTVMIHDQECATELRRKRKRKLAVEPARRVFINERVCEGCGDCGAKSNCLSVQPVETVFGRKTRIDQTSCNKDFSCLDGDCPSFISVRPGTAASPGAAGEPLAGAALPDPEVSVGAADFGMRITGIGGTGVVTTAQIVATAAVLSGLYVQSLDQTGLAQKGGAVVSDILLSRTPRAGANKLGPGSCDLYMGCDLLVAAQDVYLTVASPDRTVAVVSTARVPTGSMVVDPDAVFPPDTSTRGRIDASTRGERNRYADARELAATLLGSDQYANLLLLGMAVQAGALPIEARRIEEAIGLNGVSVDRNVQAFRRGRQVVADPDAIGALLEAGQDEPPPPAPSADAERIAGLVASGADGELAELVLRGVGELIAYQSTAYAERFARFVERVREAESAALREPGEISRQVARYLFKLMAYKDEYEVARLSLDPALRARLRRQFGADVRYEFLLHPPVLRAMGLSRKIRLGPWSRPAFRMLHGMRGLRGTRLDPFRFGEVRATERALIGEYTEAIGAAVAALSDDNAEIVAEMAGLPDLVRGYEGLKLKGAARMRARMAALSTVLAAADEPVEDPDERS